MSSKGIDQAVTRYRRQYVTDLKEKRVKPGESFAPDLSEFDKLRTDVNEILCRAFRDLLQGRLVGNEELQKRLAMISEENRRGKSSSKVKDIDGDGVSEVLDQYEITPGLEVPQAPAGKLCGIEEWGLIKVRYYQPFLYVYHFSTGGHAIIESMAFLLEARNKRGK